MKVNVVEVSAFGHGNEPKALFPFDNDECLTLSSPWQISVILRRNSVLDKANMAGRLSKSLMTRRGSGSFDSSLAHAPQMSVTFWKFGGNGVLVFIEAYQTGC